MELDIWYKLDPPEKRREYVYPDGGLVFFGVTDLKVSSHGNHYFKHQDGYAIVAHGWRAILLDIDAMTV